MEKRRKLGGAHSRRRRHARVYMEDGLPARASQVLIPTDDDTATFDEIEPTFSASNRGPIGERIERDYVSRNSPTYAEDRRAAILYSRSRPAVGRENQTVDFPELHTPIPTAMASAMGTINPASPPRLPAATFVGQNIITDNPRVSFIGELRNR
jgi:hypothetical protein